MLFDEVAYHKEESHQLLFAGGLIATAAAPITSAAIEFGVRGYRNGKFILPVKALATAAGDHFQLKLYRSFDGIQWTTQAIKTINVLYDLNVEQKVVADLTDFYARYFRAVFSPRNDGQWLVLPGGIRFVPFKIWRSGKTRQQISHE